MSEFLAYDRATGTQTARPIATEDLPSGDDRLARILHEDANGVITILWQTGDAKTLFFVGDDDAGNNQVAIRSQTGSGLAALWGSAHSGTSGNNAGVIGQGHNGADGLHGWAFGPGGHAGYFGGDSDDAVVHVHSQGDGTGVNAVKANGTSGDAFAANMGSGTFGDAFKASVSGSGRAAFLVILDTFSTSNVLELLTLGTGPVAFFNGAIKNKRRIISASDFLLLTDNRVDVDTSAATANVVVTLLLASQCAGRTFIVFDAAGNASVRNIQFALSTGDTWANGTSANINITVNGQGMMLEPVSDSAGNWRWFPHRLAHS